MRRDNWLKKAIWAQVSEIRQYNRYGRRDMVARNMVALKLISSIGLAVTLVVFACSRMEPDDWDFMWDYWALIPTYAAFSAFSFIYGGREHKRYVVVQTAGCLFSICLIAVISFVSIVYYPDKPDELLSFVLILIPLFFAIETWIVASITTYGGVIFCILAYSFKAPDVVQHDVFSIAMAILLSLVVLGYHARIRAHSFIVKEKYKALSRMDLLTELLNKKSYELWCQRMLDDCEEGAPCALAIFDLDNFKQINDSFGHIMGDRVLEIVGQALSSHFHADCFVGRVGGDEFSAFTCKEKCCGLFERRAENVMAEVKERSMTELKIDVTMSMGTAFHYVPVDYMQLYFDADKALYEFKRSIRSERYAVSAK